MKCERLWLPIALVVTILVSGCAATRPTGSINTDPKGRWATIEAFRADWNSVITPTTTVDELNKKGFGPKSPNVTRVGYLSVLKTLQGIDTSLLPEGITSCLKARDKCTALVFEVKRIKKVDKASTAGRLLFADKKEESTGWTVAATIFVKIDDKAQEVAVYTSKDETPNIYKMEKDHDPLHLFEKVFWGAIGAIK